MKTTIGPIRIHRPLTIFFLVVLTATFTGGVAFSAPGDYPPNTTSEKYVYSLTGTEGELDSPFWGLDNGIGNANLTGEGTDGTEDNYSAAIKSVYGERVHGEYRNDTNSCASCHQTHTASGKSLLFKNGVYNTCSACHDGTLGFYDVFATGDNASNAGTFGGNPDKKVSNASVHLATGVMKINAAPGGDRDNYDERTWGKQFTCSSCHSPHGSYSDRLLHYNPNGIATTPPVDSQGNPTGGKLMQNIKVAFDSNIEGGAYVAQDVYGNRVGGPWLAGYEYVTWDQAPQYWSEIRVKKPGETVFTAIYSGIKTWNDVLAVNYAKGFLKDPGSLIPIGSHIQMDIAPVLVVKMYQQQTGIDPNGTTITKVTGYQKGINEFCSACHTDYVSDDASIMTGTFSQAFRHDMNTTIKPEMIGADGKMVCLTCHYAHGTEKAIMKDEFENSGLYLDVNDSSALKRYVNSAACFKCHLNGDRQVVLYN